MIVVKNVSKSFELKNEKFYALKNVSFVCNKGEIFGLLGPNGAGKTTLLRIISTIMKPSSGSIRVNDYDCALNPREVKKKIGYLSTETGIYDRFTPREILRFFGLVSGIERSKLDDKIQEIMMDMEMEEYADKRVDRFSTGMKQKVSIARSLINDPEVIIFDEPTNGLDVVAARIVKDNILKLKEMEKCIVLSTHLMNDVDELCDKIGIINRGEIINCGAKDEIKKHYNTNSLEEIFFKTVGGVYES